MNTYFYVDASGQSIDTRLWGIFVIIGQNNESEVQDIIRNFCNECENFHELKSKWLSFEQKKKIVLAIQQKKLGMFFCQRHIQNNTTIRSNFLLKVKNAKNNKNILKFYNNLKKVNQVKFASIVNIIQEAIHKINTKNSNLHIYIDNENLPKINNLAAVLEEYIQIIAFHKKNTQSIHVHPASDSQKIAGIQYVDIFLGYIREVFEESSGVFLNF